MTLLIGIKCQGGIVFAGDTQATYGIPGTGMSTIAQHPSRKLHFIDDEAVMGVAGSYGIAQSLRRIVERELNELSQEAALVDIDPCELKDHLSLKVRQEMLGSEFHVAKLAGNLDEARTHTILGLASAEGPTLIEFNHTFTGELKTADLPFVAVGNGQVIADPFLAFIRRMFWAERLPRISEGIFAGIWTLHHCMRTAPAGVGGAKQVIKLFAEDGRWQTRELSATELYEHEQSVADVESGFTRIPRQTPSEPMPEPGAGEREDRR